MTTREDVRIKLTERIEALKLTWTDYPLVVEYDNAEAVNEAEQSTPYLSVRQVYICLLYTSDAADDCSIV